MANPRVKTGLRKDTNLPRRFGGEKSCIFVFISIQDGALIKV